MRLSCSANCCGADVETVALVLLGWLFGWLLSQSGGLAVRLAVAMSL